MKKEVLFTALIAIVFMTSFVAAAETTLIINAPANFSITGFVSESGEGPYTLIDLINENTGTDGRVLYILDTDEYEFDLKLDLKKDGEVHYSVKYDEPFQAGDLIEIDFYPKWSPKPNATITQVELANESVEITNETSEEVPEVNETATDESAKISGHVVFNGKTIAYTGGIIVLIIIILFLMRWRVRSKRKSKPKEDTSQEIKVKKLSEVQQTQGDNIKAQEAQVEETRRKLKEAEDKLQRMKNPNMSQIDDAKRKLIEDERELMRLRKEYSSK